MTKVLGMIHVLINIEQLREDLKRCKTQAEMREVHERLVTMYACIDTNTLIDKLSSQQSNPKKVA